MNLMYEKKECAGIKFFLHDREGDSAHSVFTTSNAHLNQFNY